MYNVSTDFKDAQKADAKQLFNYVTDDSTPTPDVISYDDDLQSFSIKAVGNLGKSVMRELKVSYFGTHYSKDSVITPYMGIILPDTSIEYLSYGEFVIDKVEVSEDEETTTVTAYDKMHEALIDYDLDNAGDYPITIGALLQAICTRLGWTLNTTTFVNSTFSIDTEKYGTLGYTFRDVIDDIAGVAGAFIRFGNNDELYVIGLGTTALETLTTGEQKTLKVEDKWGGINSVVLNRDPANDFIAQKDDADIALNGLYEYKLNNNWLVDSDRVTAITPLYNELHGKYFYPFNTETASGLGYFEVGDMIAVTDLGGSTYLVCIMDIDLTVGSSITEVLSAGIPDRSYTPYENGGIIGRRIRNTEIQVDKNTGEIAILTGQMAETLALPRQAAAPESPSTYDLWLNTTDNIIYIYDGADWQPTSISASTLDDYYTKDETLAQITLTADEINLSVEATHTLAQNAKDQGDANSTAIENVVGDITTLTTRADGLDISVQGLGGVNLLQNSVGLKGSIEEWQVFDDDGVLLDSRNAGEVVQDTDTVDNTVSGSSIKLVNQFIVQTVSTIIGNTYTVLLYFKKDTTLNLYLTGVSGAIEITAGGYVDDTWAVFKYQFTATSSNTEIKIENTTAGYYGQVSDIVLKLGDCNNWTPAPNEIYGSTYQFSKDGFKVFGIGSNFYALLDNTQLVIYDQSGGTDRIVARFSIDAGKISNLIAQDELIIQRYENPAKRLRFLPTSTGAMLVIDD